MNGSLNELNGFYGYVIKHKRPIEAKKFIEENANYISNMICNIDRGGFDKRRDNVIVPGNVIEDYKREVLYFLGTLKIKFPDDEHRIDDFSNMFNSWDPAKGDVGDIDFMIRRLLLTIGDKPARDEIKRLQLDAAVKFYKNNFGEEKIKYGVHLAVKTIFDQRVIEGVEVAEGSGYSSKETTGDFYRALRRALGFDNTKTRSKRK